ncbi:MAG: hypothetical protein Ta2D_01910 [Rickettsiales bacterium]|nr:MAG: hypothetical protein Ta2D_01910 [Rickettsiales bacterium]
MTEIPNEQNMTSYIQGLMDNGVSPQQIWGAFRNQYQQYLLSNPLPQEQQQEIIKRVAEIDNDIINYNGQNPEQLTNFISKLEELNTNFASPNEQQNTPPPQPSHNWTINELMENGASPQEIWNAYRDLYQQYLLSYPLPQEKQQEVMNRVAEIDNEINKLGGDTQNPEEFINKLQKLNYDYTDSNSPIALPNGHVITQTLNNSFTPTTQQNPQEQIQQTDDMLKHYTPSDLFRVFKVSTEQFLEENLNLSDEQKDTIKNSLLEMEKQIDEKFRQYEKMTPEEKEQAMQETMANLKNSQEDIFSNLNEEEKIRFQQIFDQNFSPFVEIANEEEKEKRKGREVWTPHITSDVQSTHYGPFVMFLLLMFPIAGFLGPIFVFFQAISPGVFPWSKNKKFKAIQYRKKLLPPPPKRPPPPEKPTPPPKPDEPVPPMIPFQPRQPLFPAWPMIPFQPIIPVIPFQPVVPVVPVYPVYPVVPVVPVIPIIPVVPVVPVVPVAPFLFYQEMLDVNLKMEVAININIDIKINIKGASAEQVQAIQKEIAELVKVAIDLKTNGGDTKEIEEKLEKLGIKPDIMEEIFEQVSPKKIDEKKEVIDAETRITTPKPDIDIIINSNVKDMDLTLLNAKFGIDIKLTEQEKSGKDVKPVIQFDEPAKPTQENDTPILPKPDIPIFETPKPKIEMPTPDIPIFKMPEKKPEAKEPIKEPEPKQPEPKIETKTETNKPSPVDLEAEEERKRKQQELDRGVGETPDSKNTSAPQMTEEEMILWKRKKDEHELDSPVNNIPQTTNFQQQLKEQEERKKKQLEMGRDYM